MRSYGETFKRFTQCLKWAKEGKTFIYYHPDFVAIDMKSWEKIQRKLKPPIKKQLIYDESSEWTPEIEEQLNKILKERLN